MTDDLYPVADALRVPIRTVPAELALTDGTVRSGSLFLPAAALSHRGPTRPEERLNDESDFFPFRLEGDERPVLVNKHRVLVASFAASDVLSVGDPWGEAGEGELAVLEAQVHAVIRLPGRELRGEMPADAPPNSQRLLDLLNRPQRFVCVRDGARVHLIGREHILDASELAPDEPSPA